MGCIASVDRIRGRSPRSVSENPVVGPPAPRSVSDFLELFYLLVDQGSRCGVTGKDGEAGDIGVYLRCGRTQSIRKTSRSKPDRILQQAAANLTPNP
jgi:hypothetical protein